MTQIYNSKLILPISRPRGLNGHGRIQYRGGSGRKEIHNGAPEEDVSKLRMIMRPLGFTVMVCMVNSVKEAESRRFPRQNFAKFKSTFLVT